MCVSGVNYHLSLIYSFHPSRVTHLHCLISVNQDTDSRRHLLRSTLVPKSGEANQFLLPSVLWWGRFGCFKNSLWQKESCQPLWGCTAGQRLCNACATHWVWAGTFNSISWKVLQATRLQRLTAPSPRDTEDNSSSWLHWWFCPQHSELPHKRP